MTRCAVIHDANMIKRCRYKARGLVAVTAVTGRWNMVQCFTYGGNTIMAGCTVIHDAGMIIFGADKGCGVMAHGTIICRGQMVK